MTHFSALASNPNAQAFLDLISMSEGTLNQPDPYRVCFGYKHIISSFADHPAITGEWRGERLKDVLCRNVGLKPGCKSTAAGAYQIIRPTWIGLKRRIHLPTFEPQYQDAGAWDLVVSCNAERLILNGKIEDAIRACRKQWASFPGAGYGQQERKLAQLLQAFTVAGGELA